MTVQAHKGPTQRATKARQNYVRAKLRACSLAGSFVILAASLLFWTASMISSRVYDFQRPNSPPPWYSFELFLNRYLDRHPEGLAVPAGRVALLTVTGLLCCVLGSRKAKEAARIPYVPPVAKQLAALRAEDYHAS